MHTQNGFNGRIAFVMLSLLVPIVAVRADTRADRAITTDVRRVLGADRSLDDSGIVVSSVSDGVVVLGGSAASVDDIVRALRATARRRGVRGVFSQIEAEGGFRTPSGARLDGIPVAQPSPARRNPVDAEDDEIRRGVNAALHALDAEANADVRVTVKGGVVSLTGSVPTWQGDSARLHAVRSVTGVRSIINELRVVALNAEK